MSTSPPCLCSLSAPFFVSPLFPCSPLLVSNLSVNTAHFPFMALSVSCSFFSSFHSRVYMHLLFTLFLSILVLDWKNDRDGARIGRVAECHFPFAFLLCIC